MLHVLYYILYIYYLLCSIDYISYKTLYTVCHILYVRPLQVYKCLNRRASGPRPGVHPASS